MNNWGESDCLINGVASLKCVPLIFENIVFWLLALVGIAAVFFIAFAGVKFVGSGGDPKQVEGARKTMTYAIIGLVIVLLSFTAINLLARVTGVECLTRFGFLCTENASTDIINERPVDDLGPTN